MYARDGDSYVIFASKAGMDTHPAWYHNLVASPQATQLGLKVAPGW